MKIGVCDMTNINGQMSLMLTAENRGDQGIIDHLRGKLAPVDHKKRQLDPTGTGNELLVVPLEHLLAKRG